MSKLMVLQPQRVLGDLFWYTNLPGDRQSAFWIVLGLDGTPGATVPLTYPFPGALNWPEPWRNAVLDAVLHGGSVAALDIGDIGLFGSGADYTELTAPGYTRVGVSFGSATDLAASGDPVAGVLSTSGATWSITLTDQDIRGSLLFDTGGAEVIRGDDFELIGVTGAPATHTIDVYSGGTAWALTGPDASAGAVLDALVNGSSYTPPAAHYLGLMEAFAFTPTELSAAGYSRKPITFGAASSGQCTNTAALNWTVGAFWHTSRWAVWDAPTGGTLLWQGQDGDILNMNAGDRLLIDVGAVKARLF